MRKETTIDKEVAKAQKETGSVSRTVKGVGSETGKIAKLLRAARSNPVLDKRRREIIEDLNRIKHRAQQHIKIESDLILEHNKKKFFIAHIPKLTRADVRAVNDGFDGDVAYTLGWYEGFGGLILEIGKERKEVEKGTFFNWRLKRPVSVLA